MNITTRQYLWDTYRMVAISMKPSEKGVTDESLVKAMTIQKEMDRIGYSLSPDNIIKIAGLKCIDTFFKDFRANLRYVSVEPMYPDFPSQVISMSEAQYRFNQILHYMSTYGIEEMTGAAVSKGWLPESVETKKDKDDISLMESRNVLLIDENDMYEIAWSKILSKKERCTLSESNVIAECCNYIQMSDLCPVAFKENICIIADIILNNAPGRFVYVMTKLCQHTGDVWKCLNYILRHKRHLRTSQKRLIIKLLEWYPISDFKANLCLSNKKESEIIHMLNFLSYNRLSKSDVHKRLIAELRNSDLKSWESYIKKHITDHEIIEEISKRPGMMFRWMKWLLTNGYSKYDILEHMDASALSAQTIVNTIAAFRDENYIFKLSEKYNDSMYAFRLASDLTEICMRLLLRKMSCNYIFKGKKVYFDNRENIDLDHTIVNHAHKSVVPGIAAYTAYKIPENANVIRFFTYWNDPSRVDVDLHSYAYDKNGRTVHIGWNSSRYSNGICTSGDITHSDAAEYIDVDLNSPDVPNYICCEVTAYNRDRFSKIETCFAGLMAVNGLGADVKLYNHKNCFFSHDLTSIDKSSICYCVIDVINKYVIFIGADTCAKAYTMPKVKDLSCGLSIREYRDILYKSQYAVVVDDISEADVVLSVLPVETPENVESYNLVDVNYWLDL